MFLYDEQEKLIAKYPQWVEFTSSGDFAEQYEEIVNDDGPIVDNAIRQFAISAKWPELTPRNGAALRERFDFAMDLANLLSQFQMKVPKTNNRAAQLIFLLIDAWAWCGFSQHHGLLENLRNAGKMKNPHEKN